MLKIVLLSMVLFVGISNLAQAEEVKMINVKITAGDHIIMAHFENNATSRALIAQFPLTVHMQNLYKREMCHRFNDALPASEATTSTYEIGDIVYWTPRHSFVIIYEQNETEHDN